MLINFNQFFYWHVLWKSCSEVIKLIKYYAMPQLHQYTTSVEAYFPKP